VLERSKVMKKEIADVTAMLAQQMGP